MVVLRETDDEEIRPVPVGARDRQVAGLRAAVECLESDSAGQREIGEGGAVLRFWDQPAVTRRDMRATGFDARKRRFHIVQNRGIGRARLLRQRVPRRCGEHHDQHRQAARQKTAGFAHFLVKNRCLSLLMRIPGAKRLRARQGGIRTGTSGRFGGLRRGRTGSRRPATAAGFSRCAVRARSRNSGQLRIARPAQLPAWFSLSSSSPSKARPIT